MSNTDPHKKLGVTSGIMEYI